MKQDLKHGDIIVGGGGRHGLVAASHLARAGKGVLRFEAQDELVRHGIQHNR